MCYHPKIAGIEGKIQDSKIVIIEYLTSCCFPHGEANDNFLLHMFKKSPLLFYFLLPWGGGGEQGGKSPLSLLSEPISPSSLLFWANFSLLPKRLRFFFSLLSTFSPYFSLLSTLFGPFLPPPYSIPLPSLRIWNYVTSIKWNYGTSILSLKYFIQTSPKILDFECFPIYGTWGAKLLNADWLRQRAYFLNHEGTFGNQESMITWCWLAECTVGFPLIVNRGQAHKNWRQFIFYNNKTQNGQIPQINEGKRRHKLALYTKISEIYAKWREKFQ